MGLKIRAASRENERIRLKIGTNPGWGNDFRETVVDGSATLDSNGRVTLTFDLSTSSYQEDFIESLSDEVYGGLEVIVKNKRRR